MSARARPSLRLTPALLALPFFVCGILQGDLLLLPPARILVAGCALLLAVSCLTLASSRSGGRTVLIASMICVTLAGAAAREIALSGVESTHEEARLRFDPIRGWDGEAARVLGWCRGDPNRTASGFMLEIEILRLEVAGATLSRAGRIEVACSLPPAADQNAVAEIERSIPLLAGHRVEVLGTIRDSPSPGNPGETPRSLRLHREGVQTHLSVKTPRLIVDLGAEPGGGPRRVLASLRRRLAAPMREGWRDPGKRGRGRLLEAFLLGGVRDMPADILRAFRTSGLSHVVAISGLQVVLVASIARRLSKLAGLPPRPSLLCSLASCGLYSALASPEASVQRACVGICLHLGARLLGRRASPPSTLALTALLVLAVSPGLIHDAGFQLSFAATAGLILVLSGQASRGGLAGGLAAMVKAGLVAQAATLPIAASLFGRISLYALPANVLAVPLGSAIVVLGGLLSIAGALWSPLAPPLVPIVDRLLSALVGLCGLAPDTPPFLFAIRPPPEWLVAAYYGALGLLVLGRRGKVMAAGGAVSGLLLMAMLSGAGRPAATDSPAGRLDVLDVGQGDSIVLRTPAGGSVLIDAGPARPGGYDAGASRVAPALRRLGVRSLDAVLLTHPHADHSGGIPAIIRDFGPGRLFLARGESQGAAAGLVSAAIASGVRVIEIEDGDRLVLGRGMFARVLGPDGGSQASEDPNARSIVLRVRYGRSSWLLTGDMDARNQKRLTDRDATLLRADLLKVPHHGSVRSLDAAFTASTGAVVAVVSAGNPNPWGHPHPEVLGALERSGIRVFRTDLDGEISALSDGRLLYAGPQGGSWPLVVRAVGRRPKPPRVGDPGSLPGERTHPCQRR